MHATSLRRLAALFSLGLWATGAQAQPEWPLVAESSGYTETSRLSDVQAGLDWLMAGPLAPRLERRVLGFSAGREAAGGHGPLPIESLRIRCAAPEPLRVLIVANIHGGEVEGKEVCMQLLREFALGQHGELLEHLDLLWVPIYNVDGNEAIGPWNRPEQNGPVGGVGERPNGQGLDLNRDLIKAEAPETAALLGALLEFDPHVFLDLHTTNGTDHGYPLTYASSLVPGLDADLTQFAHMRFLPSVAATLRAHGLETFDYGNLEPSPELADLGAAERPDSDLEMGGAGPQAWRSFDFRPRFLTNYVGLHNRIAVLSEAFSYADFATRIVATRSFVLAVLSEALDERKTIQSLCREADRRAADRATPLQLARAAVLEKPWPKTILMQRVTEQELILPDGRRAMRRQASGELRPLSTHAQVRFEGRDWLNLPAGWAIDQPSAELEQRLRLHGIRFERLEAPLSVPGERFVLTTNQIAARPFQGHRERSVTGHLEASLLELPVGSLLVPRDQARARLAAWLLEPESPDSLASWNLLDAQLENAAAGSLHPVQRLSVWPSSH